MDQLRENPRSKVVYTGYLMKKSPKKIGNVARYQKRYFILKKDTLEYFQTEKDVSRTRSRSMSIRRLSQSILSPKNTQNDLGNALGVILICDIADVRLILHREDGCCFDILLSNSDRVYKLKASCASVALKWTEQIARAVESKMVEEDTKLLQRAVKDKPNRLKFMARRSVVSLSSTLSSGKNVTMQMSTFQSKLMSLLVQGQSGPLSPSNPSNDDDDMVRQLNSFSLSGPADPAENFSETQTRSAMEREFAAAQRQIETKSSRRGSIPDIMIESEDEDGLTADEDISDDETTQSRRFSFSFSSTQDALNPSVSLRKRASISHASKLVTDLSARIPGALMGIGGDARLLSFLTKSILDKSAELEGVAMVEFSEPIRRERKSDTSNCPISGCKLKVVGSRLYCSMHEDQYDPCVMSINEDKIAGESRGAGRERIHKLFNEIPLTQKIQLLKVIFTEGNDGLSQGLALRLLWLLLSTSETLTHRKPSSPIISMQKDEEDWAAMTRGTRVRLSIEQSRLQSFEEFVEDFCTGERFNSKIRDALLDIAFPKNFAFYLGQERQSRVSSVNEGMKVSHSLMMAVKNVHSDLAVETLEDLNFQFLDRAPLCNALWGVPYWQESLVRLLENLDLTGNDRKMVQLVMNLLVIMHTNAFLDKDNLALFYNGLGQTLRIIRQVNFTKITSDFVARTMLGALVSKISSAPSRMPLNLDSAVWENLLHLVRLIWKFVFSAPEWPYNEDISVSRLMAMGTTQNDALPFRRKSKVKKSAGIDIEMLENLHKSHQRESSRNLTWTALLQNSLFNSNDFDGDVLALGTCVDKIALRVEEDTVVDFILMRKMNDLLNAIGIQGYIKEESSKSGDEADFLARAGPIVEFFEMSFTIIQTAHERARPLNNKESTAIEQFVNAKSSKERQKIIDDVFSA